MIILAALVAGAVIASALLGARYASAGPAMAASTVQPMVAVQVYSVQSVNAASFSYTFTKLNGDLARFDVISPSSVVELVINSRLSVGTFCQDRGAVYFELRVDDAASTHGIARTYVLYEEATKYVPTSITGIFTNLSSGPHNVSMWVKCVDGPGSGSLATVNPGGYDADHLVVKEYLPIGFVYLPAIRN
jgi:hypothetical protein